MIFNIIKTQGGYQVEYYKREEKESDQSPVLPDLGAVSVFILGVLCGMKY